MLRWRKPNDNGANITRYTVYQRVVSEDADTSDWQLTKLNASVCEYVIHVERGKKYDFIVTATNKCGESEKNEGNAKRVDVSGMFSLYIICSYVLGISYLYHPWNTRYPFASARVQEIFY